MQLTGIVAAIVVLSWSMPVAADVIYSQPPQSPVISTRASQGTGFQTFDNFTLVSDTTITDVHWQGSYFNAADQSEPPDANAVIFQISFWYDFGRPDFPLYSTFITPTAANETFVGGQFSFNLGLNLAVYNYDADIPAFLAGADFPYWLSVSAILPAGNTQWGWNGGTGGDGTSYQTTPSGPGFVNFDRTFSLTDATVTPVPEPGSIALLSGSLFGLLGLLWWYRRNNA